MEQTFQGAYFRSRVLDEDDVEEEQPSDTEADETDSFLTSTGSRNEDSSSHSVSDDQPSISLSLLSLGSSRGVSERRGSYCKQIMPLPTIIQPDTQTTSNKGYIKKVDVIKM